MTPAAGAKLGPYEILGPIGAGGMGPQRPLTGGLRVNYAVARDGRFLIAASVGGASVVAVENWLSGTGMQR